MKKLPMDTKAMMELQKRLVPEIIDKLIERYEILSLIHYNQPIGRRGLAHIMELGERIIRSEVSILKDQGFVEINVEGMKLTEFGENTLEALKDMIHSFKDLDSFERAVAKHLRIKKVIIIPNVHKSGQVVLKEVGKGTAHYLRSILENQMVIGVTGGETMSMLAAEMPDSTTRVLDMTVVPARGGMGKEVEKQANTIAANLAKKLKASYKLLHMPDNISKGVMESLTEEPSVKDVMEYIQKIRTLVFGIGRADKMAQRRGLDEALIKMLLDKGAVAEAFGYYFNKNGEIIHEVNTVGVSLEQYKKLNYAVAAAAGEEKAEAVIAISKLNKNLVLVVDESLAKEILKFEN